jgi:hypothetical protein
MINLNEATPCDDCQHAALCGQEEKACTAFALYVHTGRVFNIKREPTFTMHYRIFEEHDNSLVREIQKQLREEL